MHKKTPSNKNKIISDKSQIPIPSGDFVFTILDKNSTNETSTQVLHKQSIARVLECTVHGVLHQKIQVKNPWTTTTKSKKAITKLVHQCLS